MDDLPKRTICLHHLAQRQLSPSLTLKPSPRRFPVTSQNRRNPSRVIVVAIHFDDQRNRRREEVDDRISNHDLASNRDAETRVFFCEQVRVGSRVLRWFCVVRR